MKLFHYATNCVESNGEAITAMVDTAKEVSFDTFERHCLGLAKWEIEHHYNSNLRLKHDRHVKYYQSTFNGKECYYLVHSAIEYIWVKHESQGVMADFFTSTNNGQIPSTPEARKKVRDAIHQRAEDELITEP